MFRHCPYRRKPVGPSPSRHFLEVANRPESRNPPPITRVNPSGFCRCCLPFVRPPARSDYSQRPSRFIWRPISSSSSSLERWNSVLLFAIFCCVVKGRQAGCTYNPFYVVQLLGNGNLVFPNGSFPARNCCRNGKPLQILLEGAWTKDWALSSLLPRLPTVYHFGVYAQAAEDYYCRGHSEIIVTWGWRMRMTRLSRPLLFSPVDPLLFREDRRSSLISEDILRLAAQYKKGCVDTLPNNELHAAWALQTDDSLLLMKR